MNSPSSNKVNVIGAQQIFDPNWKGLYKIAGVAAVIVAVFIPIQVIILILWPPPSNIVDWFTLFQNNNLLGLLDMDLLLVIDQVLMILIFLALFTILRHKNQSLMAIALVVVLVAITAYLSSGACFNMLSLSGQYATASTEAQRSAFIAAGEATMANYMGTAFNVSYVLEGIALLISAGVLIRSNLLGKAIAYVGLATGILSVLPPTAGMIGLVFAMTSLVPLETWLILLAVRFLRQT